jgi:hypothetical protein
MKVCSKCGEAKPIDAFSWNDARHVIRRAECRTCVGKRHAEYVRQKISVACPTCGVPREVSRGRKALAEKRQCRKCMAAASRRKPGQPGVILSTNGTKASQPYVVRWLDESSSRWRSTTFPTREAAARFRRGLLSEVAAPRSNDPLATTYQLIRKALASVDAARLSRRDEDALTTHLYEAEDVVAALLRTTERSAA